MNIQDSATYDFEKNEIGLHLKLVKRKLNYWSVESQFHGAGLEKEQTACYR